MVWQKPRENAVRILLAHNEGRGFVEDLLTRELAETRLRQDDRALVQEICFGTIRWRATLDWLIDAKAFNRPPPPPARVLLRAGLYQLFFLDRIPDHAVVNETVDCARNLGLEHYTGFLNAMLRNYTRAHAETRATLLRLRTEDPALGWSHPRWLVERWQKRLSPADLQALLEWDNTPAPVFARINGLKTDAAQVIEAWRGEGVEYDFKSWEWTGLNLVFQLRRHPPLERMKSFTSGSFYIQDPSTLASVRWLDPKPGERILDLCAAPGGKTTFIAQLTDNDGHLVACDPDPQRRQRLKENCERLGADVETTVPDAPSAAGPFDAILVDAPCSNSGVLRRRIDARWRLTAQELERCRALQSRLLETASARLKPGGRVVYSTCSLEPEENSGTVDSFLEKHPAFRLVRSNQFGPIPDGVDGAFVALLQHAG